VSDIAIEHALLMGKTILADIHLIHIVENKKQVSEARLKLDALKDRVRVENGVEIHAHVRIGNIFEDIDKAATEMDAALIIMGTHGARGMQFMSGSRALKIVTESSIPFIVVQERTIREQGYHRLVVPLDLHKETKQKLSAVRDIAKYFNSKVYLISPNETDEFLKNQLDRNLNYAVEYLSSKNIPVEVEITETRSEGSFVKSLLKYSAAIEADLICIMNFYESSLLNVFNSSYEQHLITNDAQIPVLCVNPVDTYIADRSSLAS
jgi:nucleotide-binding universal stress UspA family protein